MEKVSLKSLDMRGKTITTHILFYTAQAIKSLGQNDVQEIVTDKYPAIVSDIKAWCRMTGNAFVSTEPGEKHQVFYIKKGPKRKPDKTIAVVISTNALDELISPLGFALGAAVSNNEVHMYFQGPGVKVLKKNYNEKLGGGSAVFSGPARKGLQDIGHDPPKVKLAQMREMGTQFYACAPSMDRYGVSPADLIFGDIILAEYITFLEVMRISDMQIYV